MKEAYANLIYVYDACGQAYSHIVYTMDFYCANFNNANVMQLA